MKSQDIFLLFKLASIEQQMTSIEQQMASIERQLASIEQQADLEPENIRVDSFPLYSGHSWQDWEEPEANILHEFGGKADEIKVLVASRLSSIRGLAAETGISKSEVSQSLKRNYFAGLAKLDRKSGLPTANLKALVEFAVHGLRYVFPVKPAEFTRGIATGVAAPVLQGQLMTAGELAPVWPDAKGKSKGQAIAPLFKSVPFAVRKDPQLYEYLALADAIRIGQPRERALASELLKKILLRRR